MGEKSQFSPRVVKMYDHTMTIEMGWIESIKTVPPI